MSLVMVEKGRTSLVSNGPTIVERFNLAAAFAAPEWEIDPKVGGFWAEEEEISELNYRSWRSILTADCPGVMIHVPKVFADSLAAAGSAESCIVTLKSVIPKNEDR
jgi:hypothetical protein